MRVRVVGLICAKTWLRYSGTMVRQGKAFTSFPRPRPRRSKIVLLLQPFGPLFFGLRTGSLYKGQPLVERAAGPLLEGRYPFLCGQNTGMDAVKRFCLRHN